MGRGWSMCNQLASELRFVKAHRQYQIIGSIGLVHKLYFLHMLQVYRIHYVSRYSVPDALLSVWKQQYYAITLCHRTI